MTREQLEDAIEKHAQDPTACDRYAEFSVGIASQSPMMLKAVMALVESGEAHPFVFVFFGMELTRYLQLDPLPEVAAGSAPADDTDEFWKDHLISENKQ